MERNLLRSISLLNLPSRFDVSRIDDQVSMLEEDLQRLTAHLTAIHHQLETRSGRDDP